jgi:hypothetical protein
VVQWIVEKVTTAARQSATVTEYLEIIPAAEQNRAARAGQRVLCNKKAAENFRSFVK